MSLMQAERPAAGNDTARQVMSVVWLVQSAKNRSLVALYRVTSAVCAGG
jgi:hypothetical protein